MLPLGGNLTPSDDKLKELADVRVKTVADMAAQMIAEREQEIERLKKVNDELRANRWAAFNRDELLDLIATMPHLCAEMGRELFPPRKDG